MAASTFFRTSVRSRWARARCAGVACNHRAPAEETEYGALYSVWTRSATVLEQALPRVVVVVGRLRIVLARCGRLGSAVAVHRGLDGLLGPGADRRDKPRLELDVKLAVLCRVDSHHPLDLRDLVHERTTVVVVARDDDCVDPAAAGSGHCVTPLTLCVGLSD